MNKQLFILLLSSVFFFPLAGIETPPEETSSLPIPVLIEPKETKVRGKESDLPQTPPEWTNIQTQNPFDPRFTPDKPEEGDRFLKEFVNMLFTLGLILGLLLVASWFVKKFTNTRIQKMNEASNIKILETRSLSPRTTIYVLDLMGKVLTVAESSNGVTQLITQSEERIE